MNDKELDKLFREKLGSYSEPAEDIWPLIEASLEKSAAVSARRARIRRMIVTIAAAAAVAAIGFILWIPDGSLSGRRTVEEHTVAESFIPPVPSGKKAEGDPETADGGTEAGRSGFMKEKKGLVTEKVSGSAVKEACEKEPSGTGAPRPASKRKAETSVASGSDARPDKPAGKRSHKKNDNPPEKTEGKPPEKQKENLPEKRYGRQTGREYYERYFSGYEDFGENSGSGKGRYLLALSSNLASGTSKVVQGASVMNMLSSKNLQNFGSGKVPQVERISDVKYSMPLNVGIQVQVKINSYLAVGLGIHYSFLQSRYDGLINKKFNRVKQSLHYIGIPVNLYAIFLEKKNFLLYANAGGSIEKGLRAEYSFRSYDGSTHAGSSISGVSYSVNAGLGAEYRFIPVLGLYLEPNVVYYFNSKIPASIRTDQPFQAKAEIGFRFHF